MKVIIAGSRGLSPSIFAIDSAFVDAGFSPTEVVSGTARGVDRCGEDWADLRGVPVKRFPADWNTYGRSAGHIRNAEMAEYADALLAFWDDESRGTANMIEQMQKRGKSVHVVIWPAPKP